MTPSEPGWGCLFQNKKKVAGSNQPDYQGTATCCQCKEPVRLAGWKKIAKTGVAYLSLKLQPEQEAQERSREVVSNDDDIPF